MINIINIISTDNSVFDIISKIFNYIWSLISIVIDTISQIIEFLKGLTDFILSYIGFLPTEILLIFNVALVIIVSVFIYRFIR